MQIREPNACNKKTTRSGTTTTSLNIKSPRVASPPPTRASGRASGMSAEASGGRSKSGSKRPLSHAINQVPGSAAGSAGYSYEEAPLQPVPLKYVVSEAVKRWFEDTYQEAIKGDVKQQALLGQMYAEGYGCEKDPKAAKEWMERASARGYKMQGVYCEL